MESSRTTTPPITTPDPTLISDEFLATLRAHGVVKASIFGSVARGTASPGNDVDLLVTFDRRVTLFDQLRLAERLRQVSGRPVDLMTEIHPAFEALIIPTLVPLHR